MESNDGDDDDDDDIGYVKRGPDNRTNGKQNNTTQVWNWHTAHACTCE